MDIHLQFLRPWWFLALLPVIWLLWQAWSMKAQQGAWQKVIDPKFQSLLLGKGSQPQGLYGTRLAIIGLAMLWVMAILALAGPSLKSVKMPAEKTQQGSVILLDLSLSMLADDMTPNRISRARFKLIDLLQKHPEQSIGLIGYAGSAHTIAPISEDNKTLLELLPALNPLIMPKYGSDPLQAFELAQQMLSASQINQGHIIWVTDDIEIEQRQQIEQWLQDHAISLSILAVGTQGGGTVHIPNYGLLRDANEQIITPKLPYNQLEKISAASGAALTPLKVDDSDLPLLIPSNLAAVAKQNQQQAADKEVVHLLDDGTAVILAMLPLLAFAYRRGWLFSLTLLMVLPLGTLYSPSSYAEAELSDFTDVFQTPDQQGYNAWMKQDLEAAASLFENSQWKGTTLYRLGRFKEAAEQFKKDNSAQGHYNLGNALAKQGLLEEAKQAYQQTLQQQPQHADAKSNLQLIEQLLNQSQSSNNSGSVDSEENQSGGQTKESQQPEQKQGEAEQGEQQSQSDKTDKADKADNYSDQASDSGKQQQTEPGSQQQNSASSQQPSEHGQQDQQTDTTQGAKGELGEDRSEQSDQSQQDSVQGAGLADNSGQKAETSTEMKQQEQQRATDNWLKQIPDQPGLFLKRKFEYQFQQQNGQQESSSKPAEKIW